MELITKIPNLNQNRSLPPIPTGSQLPRPPAPHGARGWRQWIFDGFAILSAGAAGYACLRYFSGGISFTLFATLAAVFLIASFFDFLLVHGQTHRQIAALLQILVFLGFFYAVKPAALLSALGVLIVFYFLAIRGANTAMENSLKFRLGSVARLYMKRIFIGFALAAILLYLPQWNSGNVFVPQPKFEQWYEGFAGLSQRLYSGADFKANVGTFAEGVVRTQLAKNSQFNALPAEQQDAVVKRAAQELITSTSKSIGLALVPEMPMAEAFYKYLLNFLTSLKAQFGDSFLAAWAVALFVIVLSVGTLGIWGLVIVTFLLFEVFAAFNVVHIAGEARTKEIIELS